MIATALDAGGRIACIAAHGGGTLQVPVWAPMRKRAGLTGSTLRPRDADGKARLAYEVGRVVRPWIEAGRACAVIDRTFPLDGIAQAHAWLEGGRHAGKVMLRPAADGWALRGAGYFLRTRVVLAGEWLAVATATISFSVRVVPSTSTVPPARWNAAR